MPHTTRPTAAAPAAGRSTPSASPLSVQPGQKLLVCLPPGASLVVESGRLALRSGPVVWGQVVASQMDLGHLEAGQCREGSPGSGPEWMEVSNPGHATAHAVLLEPAPALLPLGAMLWTGVAGLAGAATAARAFLAAVAAWAGSRRRAAAGPRATTAR
ncbi:hypothetical protein [Paracidovorax avenae]|uniref:hypothetical protein n=1 Tax=Paracidovorax avenae TaxID=80867 RepID=UPI000D215285|nr:hypothetical protein [Paracidovorax avenae]AVT03426.1 hypothetical protein C8243_13670 [Paracidovorax avenae]